ncbi:MAG: GAF domain-containing protein, partial [Anderseniella sp.]
MTPGKPDLTSCDTEPIHEIGSIQPFGALLAVNEDNLIFTHVSENIGRFLDAQAKDILGKPLTDFIGASDCQDLLQRQLEPKAPHLLRPWFFNPPSGSEALERIECLPHRHGGKIIIEILQNDEGHADVWQQELLRQNIISQLMSTDSLSGLSTVSANLIREVTGFDRVMIYRFAEDGHGEVIAEATSRTDSFMGMHYPASDIPEPARRHFTLNLIRAISDINAVPSPILTRDGEKADTKSGQPLDLTYSKLRAVAPVHIEYLNNMGVGASMSISLVSNDELWGLVACHHYSPHHLSSSVLRYCEMLGSTVSKLLQNLQNTEMLRRSIMAERTVYDLEMTARSNDDLHQVVTDYSNSLMNMVDANSMIFKVAGKQLTFGTVPDGDLDFHKLSLDLQDGVSFTDHLSSLTEMTPEQIKLASGAGYLELSE